MFNKISKYLKENFTIDQEGLIELERFFDSLNKSTVKLEMKMEQIGEKYKFSKLNDLKTPREYDRTNTLFFWRELCEFPMSIALDEEEIDKEFMLFIDEDDIYSPYFESDNGDLSNVCYDIYHSWVAFIFQKLKLYNNGIPMGITVNSDIVSYYFNDFSYYNFSNYHQLYDTKKEVSRPYKRDLTIEEIFIRTHFIQFPYKRIKLTSSNKNIKQIAELVESKIQISQIDLLTGETNNQEEKKLKLGSQYERKEGSDIDFLIRLFESTVNGGLIFDLNESNYEK